MYKIITIAVAAITLLTLSGCGLLPPQPQNADEYRKGIKAAKSDVNIDTYIVKRSFKKVVQTIKKQAKKCLPYEVTNDHCSTYRGSTSCSPVKTIYTPTIRVSNKKMELHMQISTEPNRFLANGKLPEKGIYTTVIDFAAAGKGKTKITAYHPTEHFNLTAKAVKHWIKGTNRGCPNYKGF